MQSAEGRLGLGLGLGLVRVRIRVSDHRWIAFWCPPPFPPSRLVGTRTEPLRANKYAYYSKYSTIQGVPKKTKTIEITYC